ncbi:glycosyltransferase [Methylobacterium sp. P31]
MKFLLVVLGTHGDVLPFLALGSELLQRGHDVALSAPAPFAEHAAQAGLSFHALGTQADFDRLVREPHLWHPRRGVATAFEYALAFAEDTFRWIEANRTEPCVVLASPGSLGARIAQDRFGLPLVTVHVMPLLIESRYAPPRLPGLPLPSFLPARFRHWLGRGAYQYFLDPRVLPRLNAFRCRLDLPSVRRLRHWWNSPTRMLLMFPDWYAPPQPDWPSQAVQVGFPLADRFGDARTLSPELAAFLDAGEPPLVFTYGSGMRQGRAFFETAVSICRQLGRRGVFLAPQDEQVPADLPVVILHQPYAPFSALLPRSAALIHHGGVGTVAQGLAAGIPQLVVPVAFDHFDEGQRLQRLGVGAMLSRRRFSARRAAAELRRLLLDPKVAHACAAAKARVASEHGLQAAGDAVERLWEAAR